ncbi:MAG: hypothetical protein PVF97_02535 [Desulfobacterales bacterium]|jgi:hypothetical protein
MREITRVRSQHLTEDHLAADGGAERSKLKGTANSEQIETENIKN